MTDTTIFGAETVWYVRASVVISTSVEASSAVLSSGFTLYIPYTNANNSNVDPSALVSSLNVVPLGSTVSSLNVAPLGSTSSAIPVYGMVGTAAPTSITGTPTLPSTNYTFLVPVTTSIGSSVDVSSLFARLVTSASPTVSGSSTIDASPTKSRSSSSTNNSTPASPSKSNLHGAIPQEDLIGGTVGGFVAGLLLGALIASLCLWTRRKGRKRSQSLPEDLGATTAQPRDATGNEKQPILVGSVDMTGWRKHLPQEKGNAAIARAFETTFEQARMHVEGYYDVHAGGPSSESVARLHQLAPEDLVDTLLQAKDATPVLEAILVRWIVQRVSLRSDPRASLLPREYSGIPWKSHWHMERDAHAMALTAESKKGFPQAFSMWRTLVGFLYPDPRSDQQYQQDLSRGIDEAVALFAQSYSPWSMPEQSSANRDDNLRNILRQASDAGIQLFQQPSTFMFDWHEDGGSARKVVITPALVRRLDEHAEPLHPAEILIKARQERIPEK